MLGDKDTNFVCHPAHLLFSAFTQNCVFLQTILSWLSLKACYTSQEDYFSVEVVRWKLGQVLFLVRKSSLCVTQQSKLSSDKTMIFQLLTYFDNRTICVSRIPLSIPPFSLSASLCLVLSFFNSPILSTQTDAHMHGWERESAGREASLCICQ